MGIDITVTLTEEQIKVAIAEYLRAYGLNTKEAYFSISPEDNDPYKYIPPLLSHAVCKVQPSNILDSLSHLNERIHLAENRKFK